MTQIFLSSSNFKLSSQCLDNRRLNKNMTEAKQVHTQNKYGYGGQGNLAPYRMWKGYENALVEYGIFMYMEWVNRLYNGSRGGVETHKAGEYFMSELELIRMPTNYIEQPSWISNEEIFSSYRSALLYKDFEYYSRFGWTEERAIPVKIDKKGNVTLPYVYGIGQ